MLFYIIILISGIVVDQLTKLYAVNVLAKVTTVPIIPNVFHLTYVENTGAAFSMLSGMQTFLIIITMIFIAGLLYLFIVLPKKRQYFEINLALAFIISGAIGNLIDRLRFHYVVDFFDFRIIGFAIFNIADILVVLGCILLVIAIWRNKFPGDKSELKSFKPKAPSNQKRQPQQRKGSTGTTASRRTPQKKTMKARPTTKRKVSDVKPQIDTTIETLSRTDRQNAPYNPSGVDFNPTPPDELPSALKHRKE
ncbi:signal peptidase II [Eubacterium sp.]|uniref:signal peptidase II n=1 Tax=Eubacterium sp. TaxID=142586 RepID=UPI002FCAF805